MTMASPSSKRDFDTAHEPSTPDARNAASITADGNLEGHKDDTTYSTSEAMTKESLSCESTPLSSVAGVSPSPQRITMSPAAQPESSQQPAKKRKLTYAELEIQRIEKQFKEQQRAEEAARLLEEKRLKEEHKKEEKQRKEEEKRQKEEEKERNRLDREKKQKVKDEEKQRKEEERQRKEANKAAERKAKEEEKAKKERSQLKLNSFFTKPKNTRPAGSPTSSRRSSVVSINDPEAHEDNRAASEGPRNTITEYEKAFPAFFLHTHTSIAPVSRFVSSNEQLEKAQDNIDASLARLNDPAQIQTKSSKRVLDEALDLSTAKRRRRLPTVTPARELMAQINGTATVPIDLESSLSSKEALQNLRKTRVKFISFYEDVRPPYIGTYTKLPKSCSATALHKNPFRRALPDKNYDYDSEAEWEDPGEGEELNSDDEEEEEEADAEEMDGFLDDEDDEVMKNKRRNVMGDMEPTSTGLVWDDQRIKGATSVAFGAGAIDLEQYRISPLLLSAVGPIDPYSTAYWIENTEQQESTLVPSTMAPPRVPLTTISSTGNLIIPVQNTAQAASGKAVVAPKPKGKGAKPLPPELLVDFKRVVDGNDFNKIGLVEILKKKFPQVSKGTITDTLEQVARREGKKEAEKKWVLI